MSLSQPGGNRQRELFPRAKRTTVSLPDDHPLVMLTELLDWTELEARAQLIRRKKLKSAAGRPPHLRILLGVLVLMALRKKPYRETEEQVRYYVPARYLCALTESEWTPDFTPVNDLCRLLGEEGVELINESVVDRAVELGLCDPQMAVADTTCQEAAIPHPNEMGLMGSFIRSMSLAAQKVGRAMAGWLKQVGDQVKEAKQKVREYRLFAKTKEAKNAVLSQMTQVVEGLTSKLGQALEAGGQGARRLAGPAIAARRKLEQLHQTMGKLLPQIRYWLNTGRVAVGKIISLHIPQLYSVVRGKVGKAVEFGLVWGITRLGGGFVLARRAKERNELVDARYAVLAVEEVIDHFGLVPQAYAYDRAGHSLDNVEHLKKLGVKQVGLAPPGRAEWQVQGKVRERLILQRAMVEGSIGTAKSAKYGFNRPAGRSTEMMGACGQRSILGTNLTRLLRGMKSTGPAAKAA
jgi:hypothetical protein